ncbi:phosphonate metabolism protein PhnM [Enterococcus sp. AZ196]|uniref:phosphonate metabolism protein PhnM n=1 Tax=Enterococcus sp. AZ196 TaxID=2774659 RepID=UPI003D2867F5
MYVITNGKIVTQAGVVEQHSILIENERIVDIRKNTALPQKDCNLIVIDAKGGWIMPGFIDLHSDYIEKIAAPRPTSLIDFELALYEAERELLTHGITTMFHSLSLSGKTVFKENPIRNSENVVKLLDLINESNYKAHLIHHRMHLRYEIDNFSQLELVKSLLRTGKIQLFSLMDHTPGQGQYRDLETYRLILAGYHGGDTQKTNRILANAMTAEKLTLEDLTELAELASKNDIPVASHDDDTVEKLDIVEQLHSSISEFPITLEIAAEAKARGLATVGGAPNVLLGKSHAGNLSVKEAVQKNLIDILCSDYYPAAMLHAVFTLWREGILELSEAVKLVTQNPAKAVGIDHEVGSIAVGKMADLLIVDYAGNQVPVVTHTFVKGVLVNETTYRI